MRAFAIDRFGGPASIRDLPMPTVGPEDVLVRVKTAGVNPIDWKSRRAGKAGPDVRFPFVLGQDAAGIVEQVGPNVSRFKPGDAVFGAFWLSGSYAEYVLGSPAAAMADEPASVDFDHAAALPTPALAALACIDAVSPNDGDAVLVVGATGGVGSYAVQIAAHRGARVIATTAGRDVRPMPFRDSELNRNGLAKSMI